MVVVSNLLPAFNLPKPHYQSKLFLGRLDGCECRAYHADIMLTVSYLILAARAAVYRIFGAFARTRRNAIENLDRRNTVAAKDDFKRGCESSGGSFVENANGEYSCNTTSGITIRCRADGQRCWIASAIADGVEVNVDVSPIGIQPVFDLPVATGIRGRLPTSSG